jgi:hypothetical protein
MSFHADLVDVGRLDGIEVLETEVVDQEEIDADELSHLGVVARVGPDELSRLVMRTSSGPGNRVRD